MKKILSLTSFILLAGFACAQEHDAVAPLPQLLAEVRASCEVLDWFTTGAIW